MAAAGLDLTDFLRTLDAGRREALYASEFVAVAVLRSLPPLAKQYALRLLYVDEPVPLRALRAWGASGAESAHDAAMRALVSLGVLRRVPDPAGGSEAAFKVGDGARAALRAALERPSDAGDGLGIEVDAPLKDAELRAYAAECWQELLMRLASHGRPGDRSGMEVDLDGDEGSAAALAFDPEKLFSRAGLVRDKALVMGEGMGEDEAEAAAERAEAEFDGHAGIPTGAARAAAAGTLTRKGYAFLLADEFTQLSVLLREYVAGVSQAGGGAQEGTAALLSFLFRLAFLKVGEVYSLGALPAAQQVAVMELASAGIVYLEPASRVAPSPRWFVPTHLAASLAAGLSHEAHGGSAGVGATDGDLIVETNFRLYCYTSSDLRVAIVSLFVKPLYRLPNLFVGLVSRDSVTDACTRGVSAEQIVAHMRDRAHWRARQRAVAVPETVADQIRLWEAQRYRVAMTRATLFTLADDDMAAAVAAAARQRGAVLHERLSERLVVVRHEAAHDMKALVKRLKKQRELAADKG